MRYLYQKDERALPGNLLNRIYRFFLSFLNKCSVFHYFVTSLSLSLSLICVFRKVLTIELSQFCTEFCEERTWARQDEEAPLLEAVAKAWLAKTQQAGIGLAGIVVISGGAVITCT
jgi:hypothetical protein